MKVVSQRVNFYFPVRLAVMNVVINILEPEENLELINATQRTSIRLLRGSGEPVRFPAKDVSS